MTTPSSSPSMLTDSVIVNSPWVKWIASELNPRNVLALKRIKSSPGLMLAKSMASRSDRSPAEKSPLTTSDSMSTNRFRAWNSKAPMSAVKPSIRANGTPRWSLGSDELPASIAGLPASRACVSVTPPLSVKTPSIGSIGAAGEPIKFPSASGKVVAANSVPVLSPIRLVSALTETFAPMKRSLPFPALLPATIEF